MNNHDGLLKKYFAQAKEQTSLLSTDEARAMILQAGQTREQKVKNPGTRGVLLTFAIGAAVMATFLTLSHFDDSATPVSVRQIAANKTTAVKGNRAGENQTLAQRTFPTAQKPMTQNRREGVAVLSAATKTDNEPIASAIHIVEPTEISSTFVATTTDHEQQLSSFTLADEITGAIKDISQIAPSSLQHDIDLPNQQNLGYAVARTNLTPLPEVAMVSGKIVITPLAGLNTPYYDDYNPMITADGRTLYFISNREHGFGGHDFWVTHKENREDLYFPEPQNLGSGINTSRDEGSASISADGQTMYFTGCHRPDGLGECDLYEARLEKEGWVEVRNLAEVNSRYWEAQPTVSADGRALYFVSNRPGVVGGHEDADIYVSYKKADGTWSTPANLGSPINTKKREDSPFIAPGGDALYFSSAGHKGMGGLDFYVSHKEGNDSWGKPENLGSAFNTPNDERFITLPAAEDVIYFASSDGQGGLNLFMARRESSSSSIVLNGTISQGESDKLIGAHLLFVDGETGEVLAGTRTNDKTEEFSLVIGESSRDRTVYVYGMTDSLGEFRARLELPSTNSYREYHCEFVLGNSQVASSQVGGEWIPELRVSTGTAPDQFVITPSNESSGELTVLDAWGHRLVEKFIRAGTAETIDLSNAPNGLYLARLGQKMAVVSIDRNGSRATQD